MVCGTCIFWNRLTELCSKHAGLWTRYTDSGEWCGDWASAEEVNDEVV